MLVLAIVCNQHVRLHAHWECECAECRINGSLDNNAGDHAVQLVLQSAYSTIQTIDSFAGLAQSLQQLSQVAAQSVDLLLQLIISFLHSILQFLKSDIGRIDSAVQERILFVDEFFQCISNAVDLVVCVIDSRVGLINM